MAGTSGTYGEVPSGAWIATLIGGLLAAALAAYVIVALIHRLRAHHTPQPSRRSCESAASRTVDWSTSPAPPVIAAEHLPAASADDSDTSGGDPRDEVATGDGDPSTLLADEAKTTEELLSGRISRRDFRLRMRALSGDSESNSPHLDH